MTSLAETRPGSLDLPLPWQIALALAMPLPIFVALNLALGALLFAGVDDSAGLGALLRFFDLNAEHTVPAWYNTILLALAAATTAVTAVVKQQRGAPFLKHWYALAAIFLYLSMDEALAIHERSMAPLRELFQLGGLLYFAWVVPGALAVAIVGVAYLRFVLALPQRLCRNIVIAAGIYVGGALLLEMVGGLLYERFGPGVLTDLTAMTEEVAEMLGIIWYIFALTEHLLGQRMPRALQAR